MVVLFSKRGCYFHNIYNKLMNIIKILFVKPPTTVFNIQFHFDLICSHHDMALKMFILIWCETTITHSLINYGNLGMQCTISSYHYYNSGNKSIFFYLLHINSMFDVLPVLYFQIFLEFKTSF